MTQRIVGYLLFLLLIATTTVLVDAACPLINGHDFNSIPTFSAPIDQEYNGGTSSHNWVVNLCNSISEPYNGVPPCPGPGFISEYHDSGCESYWDIYQGSNPGNVLTYSQSGTDNRVAEVSLTCGSTLALQSTGNVVVTGPVSSLHFAFSFSTSAVCGGPTPAPPGPTPAPPGPTPAPTPQPPITPSPPYVPGTGEKQPACPGGCVFTIIVFVGLGVYVIGMVLFYYFYRKYRGFDLIPHKWFWKELPFLFKDGIVFTVNKIRALACKSGPLHEGDGSYQQM